VGTVEGERGNGTYGDLEINHLLCKCRHHVVEAEPILPNVIGCKDIVALSLFCAFHDEFLVRACHGVVDVKGATRLDL
jgi:hypothetical protein